MDYLAGLAVSVPFHFEQRGEPTVPTAGSVTYTIRNHQGQPFTGHIDVPVTTGPADTFITLEIPADVNAVTRRIEKRFVTLSYKASGKSYQQTVSYRLVPFLNHTVTPNAVRAAIGGLGVHELKDSEIDLVQAYLEVEAAIGQTRLETALSSGTLEELNANNAILFQAALNLIPAIKLRVMQEEQDGQISIKRGDVLMAIDALEIALRQRLNSAVTSVSGRAATAYTLVAFSTPTDPITGA